MTTIAMIAGMLPIALGIGAGSEARAPMAICVVGGLITSTVLTLIIVPVVFTYVDDLQKWFARFLPKAAADHAASLAEVAAESNAQIKELQSANQDTVGAGR
jgi:predicted RND superfamily exporter protein